MTTYGTLDAAVAPEGESSSPPPPPSPPWYKRPIPNPIAWAGWIATVLALLLAFYFYLVPSQRREFSYLVHRSKTVIVKSGELSSLTVSVGGQPVTTDLTAAVVAFWNTGNEAIRHEHILTPLVLTTEPSVPIVDVILRKVSRDEIVRPIVDQTNRGHGQITVSWNIMEPKDGFALQVVYAGRTDTKLNASAALEGQRTINRLEEAELTDEVSEAKGMKGAFFATLTVTILHPLMYEVERRKKKQRLKMKKLFGEQPADAYRKRLKRRIERVGFVAMVLAQVGAMIYLGHSVWFAPAPPFGF